MALPKTFRVKKKKDFEKVFKKGMGLKNNLFLIRYAKNNLFFDRGAVVVPVSVSTKAVERNKIRRTVSEALKNLLKNSFQKDRQTINNGNHGWDVIVVVRTEAKEKNFNEITSSLRDIFQKANIV